MKRFIVYLEILLFICTLTICFLWYKSPRNINYPIYFAIFTVLTGGLDLLRRNMKIETKLKYSDLIFDNGQPLFTNYTDEKYNEIPTVGLIFYSMKITNVSDISFKIKELYLEYKLNDSFLKANLQFIPCDYQSSPLYENNISQVKILFKDSNSYIILQGWKNFNLTNSKYVTKGNMIDFSLCFIFNEKYEDLYKIKDLQLIINDYSGNKIKHPIKIEQQWIENGKFAFLNYNDNLPETYKKENNINPFQD